MPTPPPIPDLPTFDATLFEPPAWATGLTGGTGSSGSKRGTNVKQPADYGSDSDDDDDGYATANESNPPSDLDPDEFLGVKVDKSGKVVTFTLEELKNLLATATRFKEEGNRAFSATPKNLTAARDAYLSALDNLPVWNEGDKGDKDKDGQDGSEDKEADASGGEASTPKSTPSTSNTKPTAPPKPQPPPAPLTSGIQEVTDEEAAAIEAEEAALARAARGEPEPEPAEREAEAVEELSPEEQRARVLLEIKDCTRAVWGNLGAVYLATGENKEAVDSCTKALEIDPLYLKALQRRALANEKIETWSSLTQSLEDYQKLLPLLPRTSPQRPAVARAVATLPDRIKVQQEKEKDEMMDKLKELGNSFLGRFGLSTDMFKFDEQPGGGYNMRFER